MDDFVSLRIAEAKELSKKQWLAKYPHAWLFSERIKMPQVARKGLDGPAASTGAMSIGDRRYVATKPSAAALMSRPESFALLPIAKTDRNMWSDRVLIGRADNNDIVFDDQSVSKAHAYLFTKSGKTLIVAYPTMNPTKINSMLLAPHGAGEPIPDDAILEFGAIGCRFVEGVRLYTLLTGRS